MTIIFQSASPSSTMARVPSTFTCITQVPVQCCGSGIRIRCHFDPWIRDPHWVEKTAPWPGSPAPSPALHRSLYSVADPGSGAFFLPLDPGSGIGKKTGSGSGMNNPDHISESLETNFLGWVKILKLCDTDPGWKKLSGLNIPDPQHWSCKMPSPFK
jgi:hypothetical protein